MINSFVSDSCRRRLHPSTIAKETLASAAPFLFFHFSKSLTTSCFHLLMFGLFICTTTSFQLFRRVSTGFRQPLYKGRKQCSPSSVTSYFPWVVVIYGVKGQAFRQTLRAGKKKKLLFIFTASMKWLIMCSDLGISLVSSLSGKVFNSEISEKSSHYVLMLKSWT